MDEETETKLPRAVVHWRTLPNGAFRQGMREAGPRGYWRVIVVRDPEGSMSRRSQNVRIILWEGRDGLRGVTHRSRYCRDDDHDTAVRVAAEFNSPHYCGDMAGIVCHPNASFASFGSKLS